MRDKIQTTHLERRAIVYLRQNTLRQVHDNAESTVRQYALGQRALDLGWPPERVEIIEDDLERSGTTAQGRMGFQRLAQQVAQGQIGAIFALEVSRLSRSSADWHRLLDLCGLAEVVLVDEERVYTPSEPEDELVRTPLREPRFDVPSCKASGRVNWPCDGEGLGRAARGRRRYLRGCRGDLGF